MDIIRKIKAIYQKINYNRFNKTNKETKIIFEKDKNQGPLARIIKSQREKIQIKN